MTPAINFTSIYIIIHDVKYFLIWNGCSARSCMDNIQSVAFKLTFDTDVFGLWCLTPLSTIFQLYHISIISWQSALLVDATGIPVENPAWTCRKSLTNFIT